MPDANLAKAADMMIRTDRMHRALIDSRVKELGIHRTQHRILMKLARCGKLPSQKELAEFLNITPAAVTGALKTLESEGYIERTLGHDCRFNELQITDKGRELVELSREMFNSIDIAMFDSFSDEELDVYIRCLDKLQNNIRHHVEFIAARKENLDNEKMA